MAFVFKSRARLILVVVAFVLFAGGLTVQLFNFLELRREIAVYDSFAREKIGNSSRIAGIELVWSINEPSLLLEPSKNHLNGYGTEISNRLKERLVEISPQALEAVEDIVSKGVRDQRWSQIAVWLIPKNGPLRPIEAFDIKKLRNRYKNRPHVKPEQAHVEDFKRRISKYPGVNSLAKFSRVGFDSTGDTAAFLVSYQGLMSTGSFNIHGSLLILEHVDGNWVEKKRLLEWIH